MIVALSLATSLLVAAPGDMPLPALKRAEVQATPKKEEPGQIVKAPDGSFYVLRTAEGPAKWPVVFVDRYDDHGNKQWSHEHEIPRAGSGKGFQYFEAAGTDNAGNLLFGYYSTHESVPHHLVKVEANGSVAWETRLDHCGYVKEVLTTGGPDDVVLGCARHGNTHLARYAGGDGSELWSEPSVSAGKSENGFAAAWDRDKNIVVVRDWSKSTDNADAGIKIAKFTSGGDLLWSKTSKLAGNYHSGGIPKLVDAFTQNNDTIAVFGVTSENVIEVHRYDEQGNLLLRDVIDTRRPVSGRVFASYGIVDNMYTLVVAWDDIEEPHEGEIGVAPLRFKRVKKPKFSPAKPAASGKKATKSLSKSKRPKAQAVSTMQWEITRLPETRFSTDDHLVDLDIGEGRPWIAAADRGSRDRVRITAIPTLHGREATTAVYGPQGRHYRPVDLHVGKHNRVHVLGIVDGLAGPNVSADSDVMRLEFWADRAVVPPKATSSSNKPVKAAKKARPRAMRKN